MGQSVVLLAAWFVLHGVIQPKGSIHLPKATQCRAMEMNWPVGILDPRGPALQERWLSWLEGRCWLLGTFLHPPFLVGDCPRESGYNVRVNRALSFSPGVRRGDRGEQVWFLQ